jgi:hypothetical protein
VERLDLKPLVRSPSQNASPVSISCDRLKVSATEAA